MIARFVYWFVGYVLWTLRGADRVVWHKDTGSVWDAQWWVFREWGSEKFESTNRSLWTISVWRTPSGYGITRWFGLKFHFAYRNSFRSGLGIRLGIRQFIEAYRAAKRMGL